MKKLKSMKIEEDIVLMTKYKLKIFNMDTILTNLYSIEISRGCHPGRKGMGFDQAKG